jgi:hypothetical protein
VRLRRRFDAEGEDMPGVARTELVADASQDGGDEELPCVRCQSPLMFVAERDFREGSGGWELAFGRLGPLFENSTRMEVWACQSCGHVEFFLPGVGE